VVIETLRIAGVGPTKRVDGKGKIVNGTEDRVPVDVVET
jgi:hypothetical protein